MHKACNASRQKLHICPADDADKNLPSHTQSGTQLVQGGVLSSLQEKIKYTKKGFCCLVVTSLLEPSKVRGAVEISLQGEKVCPCPPAEADMSAG